MACPLAFLPTYPLNPHSYPQGRWKIKNLKTLKLPNFSWFTFFYGFFRQK